MRRIMQWVFETILTIILLARLPAVYAAETALKVVDVSLPAVSLLQSPLFAAIEAGAFKSTAWRFATSLPERGVSKR